MCGKGVVSSEYFKFPSTPHLRMLNGAKFREDKVLTAAEQREFLLHEIFIEEKLDGANLGISFDRYGNVHAQNRGSYVHQQYTGQWRMLYDWLSSRKNILFEFLGSRYILFGEWCYATHTIFYDRLPDWFLGFDLFDTETRRFVSVLTRQTMFELMEIQSVPIIASGHFTLGQVVVMLKESEFGPEPAEGLYLKCDEKEWLSQRAKLARAGFMQSIEQHWSRKPLFLNQLRSKEAPPSSGRTAHD
ncbi:MAG: RNA ligase family protein [Pirellulaceae bacterium]